MSDHFGTLCIKGLNIALTNDDTTSYGRIEKWETESANVMSTL